MPKGMLEFLKHQDSIFVLSSKAALGQHDDNIGDEQAAALLGEGLHGNVLLAVLIDFAEARKYGETRGIIMADTTFELNLRKVKCPALTRYACRIPPRSDLAKNTSRAESSRVSAYSIFATG